MDFKKYSTQELELIFDLDFRKFLEISAFHKQKNPEYFSSIIVPFFNNQKELGKIPVQYIKKEKENKINDNVDKESLTDSNKNELPSADELETYAKGNFKYFMELANKYHKENFEFYDSTVKQIQEKYEEKRRNFNLEINKVKDKKGKIRWFLFLAFIVLIFMYDFYDPFSCQSKSNYFIGYWEPSEQNKSLSGVVITGTIKYLEITNTYCKMYVSSPFENNGNILEGPEVRYNTKDNKIILGENSLELVNNNSMIFHIRDHGSYIDFYLKRTQKPK